MCSICAVKCGSVEMEWNCLARNVDDEVVLKGVQQLFFWRANFSRRSLERITSEQWTHCRVWGIECWTERISNCNTYREQLLSFSQQKSHLKVPVKKLYWPKELVLDTRVSYDSRNPSVMRERQYERNKIKWIESAPTDSTRLDKCHPNVNSLRKHTERLV